MDHCDIHTTLEHAGLSKTSQRVAVLTVLVHSDTPVTVKDILDRISAEGQVNKVTVYRILSSFKAEGIIREIATDHGVNFYEMACRHNPAHPHFYCRICRSLSCLPPAGIPEEWLQRLRSGNPSIESVVINFTGLCKSCQNGKGSIFRERSRR